MKRETIDAMDALMQFADAMQQGVTVLDLQEAMQLAIADGHDMLAIDLAMAQVALERCQTHQAVT